MLQVYARTSVQNPRLLDEVCYSKLDFFDDLLLGSGAKGHGDMGRRRFNLQTQKKLTQPF